MDHGSLKKPGLWGIIKKVINLSVCSKMVCVSMCASLIIHPHRQASQSTTKTKLFCKMHAVSFLKLHNIVKNIRAGGNYKQLMLTMLMLIHRPTCWIQRDTQNRCSIAVYIRLLNFLVVNDKWTWEYQLDIIKKL